jgi:hypothetical protein
MNKAEVYIRNSHFRKADISIAAEISGPGFAIYHFPGM